MMRLYDSELLCSATDLARFLGCRHRTGLDLAVANGELKRATFVEDPRLELLWAKGLAHEKAYVDTLREQGKSVEDLSDPENRDLDAKHARTLDAIRRGADIIVQGTLRDGQWMGYPDIMQRVATRSDLGDWSYEIADTKLARETKAGTILQLSLYSELLATAQGVRPENFYVVTPNPVTPVETYRVDDYAAYFRLVRTQMLSTIALGHDAIQGAYYPEPVEHCEICDWYGPCADRRREDDHLSLVAGISRTQRRELVSQSTPTLTALAGMPLPLAFKPDRGSASSYERVAHQARIQHASRGKTPPLHKLLDVEAPRGLCRLPEPTDGDLFLDLEGDPFAAEGGREYLFGVVSADGTYQSKWAFTEAEEKTAFEWFMDLVQERVAQYPGMHVYHYAPYEPSAFKRMMGRHVTRERELDAMLRSERFVDLYAVVRQGLRAGVERYSIKNMEPLYDFRRDVDLKDARKALTAMELALGGGSLELLDEEFREQVKGYNRDDCVSTLALRNWLESLRAELIAKGTEVPRPAVADGAAPEAVDERTKAVEELRSRLLEGPPEDRAARSAEEQGRWLLVYMLDYHRREDKFTWFRYFELCDAPEEDLYDEREAVAGMEFVETVYRKLSVKGKPTGSVVDRYRYPLQEVEIGVGCEVHTQDKKRLGQVVALDTAQRTIDIEKGPKRAAEHPSAIIEFTFVSSKPMEEALLRIGTSVANADGGYRAAQSLLAAEPPRLLHGAFLKHSDEQSTAFAVRIVGELDESVLPIQGPPGAGKTYCGARMICELVRQGKKVGVTANSHAVIRNLLDEVIVAANEARMTVKILHKVGEVDPDYHGDIRQVASDDEALDALRDGEAHVVGGTAWLWAKEKACEAVNVLFVDEAGQMALANVVAVSQAAKSVVLLGDPQQLEQPRKGTHPDGVGVSALQHLLGDHLTIPDDRGIFLPETWRMAPSICAFTSELFYERRLRSRPGLENQHLAGVGVIPAQGLMRVDVEHDGNRNYSVEEVDVIEDLVKRLTTSRAQWIDQHGQSHPLLGSNILVVAPYNAHVNRLRTRLAGTGVAVGTVDKFQGQEAPVVIYSMATSRAEDAPRGMEFLFSLNRLNVATSRARCLAVLVASPRLFEPECRTPRQMRLANGLCRFREMAETEK